MKPIALAVVAVLAAAAVPARAQTSYPPPPPQQPPPSQPSQPPPAPPPSTTIVTPPPPATTVVTDGGSPRRVSRRSPMEIVALDALYGGAAGLLVGAGVALINEGDDWGKSLMIGAGSGILVGTAVGVVHAYQVSDDEVRRGAFDGQGSTARDPVVRGPRVVLLRGRF